MTRHLSWRALFAALVVLAVALGATTPLPTTSVWRDNVWVTAQVTTRGSGTTTYPGGLAPGTNTTFAATPVVTQNERYAACIKVTVTTESTTAVKWSVRLDTKAQPWNGSTDLRTDAWYYPIAADPSNGRYLIITGAPNQTPARDTVVKGKVHEFTVCGTPGEPPIADSFWVKITVSAPVLTTSSTACKTVTAVALGKTPFWFRWQATVETANLFAALGPRGSYWWAYSNDDVVRAPASPSTDPANPSTVVLTAASYGTTTVLKDEMRYDYTLCLKSS